MFLAIINDTYTEVKAELEAQKAERLVGDYFKKGYKNVINNVTGKGTNRPQDIMNAVKAAYADDEIVTYAELRQNLKKANFSDIEIEMFVSQYDTDENDLIDEREAVKIFKDMADGKNVTGLQEGLKINLKGKKKLPPPNDADVENLVKRIYQMEDDFGLIVEKLETAMEKMAKVENHRSAKKESMNKILDTIIDGEDGCKSPNLFLIRNPYN